MALTERQQEIKDLIEQGNSAEQVGKQLKISTNAVYQQLRRMRNGAKGAKKSGRKSTTKRGTSPKVTPRQTPAPSVAAPPTTPLQAVRARRDEIKATVGSLNSEVEAARKALAAAEAIAAKAALRHKDELKALDRAEAALRPSRPAASPAKPARKRAPRKPKAPASANGSQAAQQPAGDAAPDQVAVAA